MTLCTFVTFVYQSMLALIVAISAVSASKVVLVVESTDKSLNNKGISNIHSGAGVNDAFISDTPALYDVSSTDQSVYQNVDVVGGNTTPFGLQEVGNVLVSASNNSAHVSKVEGGYLTINGSTGVFYACNFLAYDQTGNASRGIGVYGKNESIPLVCTSIKIKSNSNWKNVTPNSSSAFNETGSSSTPYKPESYTEPTSINGARSTYYHNATTSKLTVNSTETNTYATENSIAGIQINSSCSTASLNATWYNKINSTGDSTYLYTATAVPINPSPVSIIPAASISERPQESVASLTSNTATNRTGALHSHNPSHHSKRLPSNSASKPSSHYLVAIAALCAVLLY